MDNSITLSYYNALTISTVATVIRRWRKNDQDRIRAIYLLSIVSEMLLGTPETLFDVPATLHDAPDTDSNTRITSRGTLSGRLPGRNGAISFCRREGYDRANAIRLDCVR